MKPFNSSIFANLHTKSDAGMLPIIIKIAEPFQYNVTKNGIVTEHE